MTNISAAHRNAFNAMCSGRYKNFCLFSCFLDGEPAAAIAAVTSDGDGFKVTPLFVSVTPGMDLRDHDGTPAARVIPPG